MHADADFWNEIAGPRWAAGQVLMDAVLEPFGRALCEAVGPVAGRSVVDVGCGCGWLSLELARGGGRVVGVDVSRPMLGRARERAADEGLEVDFRLADAQTEVLDGAELVVSRFGVMFFADPAAAFANLAGWLGSGGELAFLCWQAAELNPWMTEAQAIVAPWIEQDAPDPRAPGPFSLADRGVVEDLLAGAGFSSVSVTGLDVPMRVPGAPDVARGFYFERSNIAAARAVSDAADAAVSAGVRRLVEAHHDGAGFELPAATWLVRARVG